MTDDQLYSEMLDFAMRLAATASTMIHEGLQARWNVVNTPDVKKNPVDLVTETDQAVEKYIRGAIANRYPEHRFIGEESYAAGHQEGLTDELTWMVDPIDGTMNFVHFNPFVACSIGVAHRGIPVVGVIVQPFLGRTFSAQVGQGAYMNRTTKLPLTGGIVQPLCDLKSCLIAAEWGTDRSSTTMNAKCASFTTLAGDASSGVKGRVQCHGLRTYGSTACNMVAVAAGELDLYWDVGCWPWDVCESTVILREAGGYLTGSKGDHLRLCGDKDFIMNRRYACVRGVPFTKNETASEVQYRLVTELYDLVETWTQDDM